MKVIGIRNHADKFGWVVTQGTTQDDVAVIDYQEVSPPREERAKQLAWVRRELLAVLARHDVENASVRLAESAQSGTPSFGRAEMDGVVQATLAESGIAVKGYRSASVRSAFGKNKALAEAAMEMLPAIAGCAKVRREQLAVAVAQYPKAS